MSWETWKNSVTGERELIEKKYGDLNQLLKRVRIALREEGSGTRKKMWFDTNAEYDEVMQISNELDDWLL